MYYLDFLAELHRRFAPRTYLEIGVASGHSLARSRCRSIGVDPAFQVDQELLAPVSLVRSTSDEFFARLARSGASPFGELPVDLAYIDGLHHFEVALRDFMGSERHCARSSVVAFDDVLPRNVGEAARERHTTEWTGDVFRLAFALARYRPDLTLVTVATAPTGTLLVTGLDPSNDVLEKSYDEITRDFVLPDPQPVPEEVLECKGAISAEEALELDFWDELRAARAH